MASASPLTAAEPFSFVPSPRPSEAQIESAPLLEPSMEVDGGFPSFRKLLARTDSAARLSSRGSLLIVFGSIVLFGSVVFFVAYSFEHFYLSLSAGAPFVVGVLLIVFGALDIREAWITKYGREGAELLYT